MDLLQIGNICRSTITRVALIALATIGAATVLGAHAGLAAEADLFREQVQPFVAKYCVECHGETTAEAQLNLQKYRSSESVGDDFRQWEHVISFVERGEMPPKSEDAQPAEQQRAEFLKSLRKLLDAESRKLAGDPGIVLPRRLSNSEYNHAIRDLTGVDIRPTSSFPVDPAAGEGFDNTGEALAMTPSLVNKQLAAAQYVADHALLTTRGIEFAPHAVATFADRSKYYEQAILRFYESRKVDYAAYLTACWEYQHGQVATPVSIKDFARSKRLSPVYFETLYSTLQVDPVVDPYFMGWLRQSWRAIPAPDDRANPKSSAQVQAAIVKLAHSIESLSRQLIPRETEAIVSNAGNGPIQHLERRRKTAAERDALDEKNLTPKRRLNIALEGFDRSPNIRVKLSVFSGELIKRTNEAKQAASASKSGFVVFRSPILSKEKPENFRPDDKQRSTPLLPLLREHAPAQVEKLRLGKHPRNLPIDADAFVLGVGESVELELPVKALAGAREMRLFLEAELETGDDASAAIAGVELREFDLAIEETKSASTKQPRTLGTTQAILVVSNTEEARRVERSGAQFCRLFPNRFYFVDDTRGLSAGFHLIEGFFRDDQPLYRHVLDDAERAEIDRLWTELEFVTGITEKMLRGFVFFERSERNFLKHADFDPFKEEDPKLVEPEMLKRFERVYLDRSGVKQPIEELANHPIHVFFEQIREAIARRAAQQQAAEAIYLTNLESFARRAYRRPLSEKEQMDLRAFYRDLAAKSGTEEAARMSIVRVLMSPYFTVRFDPAPEGDTVRPLNDLALASRLSFFLWSSGPDAELLEIAEAGKLRNEQTLREQVRRMLRDPRVTDFAREFFGQWLGYRDFERQESIDRKIFPEFDDALKQAMFEEPTRLAAHLIQENLPVTKLLDGNETFVNERLARHYGMPFDGVKGDWKQVSLREESGRGGLMGMAVFLTRNSQPQRTSPVKRGFWVVHKVLGEHIPAPPADVVALPAKETDTNGKTIRQLLAAHVEDVKCARCHVRFDSVGLAMEGFDAIGRRRTKDLAGRAVDNVVELPSGEKAQGVPEFARYLARERREEFVNTLCRKLLGYALGRSLQLSDQPLLEEMRIALDKHDDRFVPLLETVVLSPQFRNQRCRDFSTVKFRSQNQGVER